MHRPLFFSSLHPFAILARRYWCLVGRCLVLVWKMLSWECLVWLECAQLGGGWCLVEKCSLLSWKVSGVVGMCSIGRCSVLSWEMLGAWLRSACCSVGRCLVWLEGPQLGGAAMAPHSSTLAWKIPWMEEPGRLQSMGSLRVGYD